MRFSALVALAMALAGACEGRPTSAQDRLVIRGPTVIGFFPPLSDDEFEHRSSGASSALEHLQFALSDVEKCLREISPHVRLELTRQLTFESGGEVISIELPREAARGLGAYLIKPGVAPRVVYATMGPSSLQQFLPDAAAEYFGVPGCHYEL